MNLRPGKGAKLELTAAKWLNKLQSDISVGRLEITRILQDANSRRPEEDSDNAMEESE